MKNNRIHKLIATAGGLGYSPKAPGTVGALGACGIALLLQLSPYYTTLLLILTLVFFALGVLSANKLEAEWGEDSSKIVIDEVVGLWIAILFVPKGLWYVLIGFVLFRFFDIVKPLYIKRMEYFRAGWGVMMDDVLAGIYSNIILQIITYVILSYGISL